jgi:hypothetical protein
MQQYEMKLGSIDMGLPVVIASRIRDTANYSRRGLLFLLNTDAMLQLPETILQASEVACIDYSHVDVTV